MTSLRQAPSYLPSLILHTLQKKGRGREREAPYTVIGSLHVTGLFMRSTQHCPLSTVSWLMVRCSVNPEYN